MDTIKTKSKTVNLSDDSRVKVKRMRWKGMRKFLRTASAAVSEVSIADMFTVTGEMTMAGLFKNLPKLIASSDDLMRLVVENSTDVPMDQFDDFDVQDACLVIEAAIDVNFDEDLKNSLGSVVNKVKGLWATPEQPSDTQTQSSQNSIPILREMGSPQNT